MDLLRDIVSSVCYCLLGSTGFLDCTGLVGREKGGGVRERGMERGREREGEGGREAGERKIERGGRETEERGREREREEERGRGR